MEGGRDLKRGKLKQHQIKYECLIKMNGGVKFAGKNAFNQLTAERAGIYFYCSSALKSPQDVLPLCRWQYTMYRTKQCSPGRAYHLTRKDEENGGGGIYTIKIGSRGLEVINELAKFKQKACSQ